MRYTHDIFVAPLVAPVHHIPRLVSYLIQSRRINTVILAQSKFGYGILPALALYAPEAKIIDYVPECSVHSDVVARESVRMDAYVDLTIVPTAAAFRCMLDHGKSVDKVVVARCVDVEFCKCGRLSQGDRQLGKQMLGMRPGQLLIAVAPPEDQGAAALLLEALVVISRNTMAVCAGIQVF